MAQNLDFRWISMCFELNHALQPTSWASLAPNILISPA
jgi:hypothetical protein